MDWIIIYSVEVLNAIATLIVMSLGLAVVFGMMKIVNMAHGEFMMLGAMWRSSRPISGRADLDLHAGAGTAGGGDLWHRGGAGDHP
ncbi:hypothetical protein ERHA55_08400 [Erwinia rhapontici]|nr:hypothetical protein [Erwinia rhapontici]BCQ43313.1 hypothetical protein ERHA55_08400 [Erwinia rhapontici]